MTATQLPLISTTHLNRGLFSDHYLNEIIPTRADWKALTISSEVKAIYAALRKLFEANPVDRLSRLDEAQLEEEWVKPILKLLGHPFSVQVKIRYSEGGFRKPDYCISRTDEQIRAVTNQIYTPNELRQIGLVAVADAKAWGVNFDQAVKGQRNPSQQIDEYLRYSELPWGVLTDGRYWRLYERDTSKYNIFYAVDLIELLQNKTVDDPFLYFYAFFRHQAFLDGWLNEVLQSSSTYAQKLSDTLEDQVYEALELIAQGFLSFRRNGLQPTPATLQTIYEQSLILLYRLLFILYAESREILPTRQNEAYETTLSLDSIKKTASGNKAVDLDPDRDEYYGKLKYLFYCIDQGSSRYDLPAYNGRLFSAKDHPFLDQNSIGDMYLVPAIRKMAEVTQTDRQGRVRLDFVDYRNLEVRHLGAIYEKLLEYQLDLATESLTVKDGKYVPIRNGEKPVKRPGEVYLRTGSDERKVSGSYYTPDYIVRFITERTLRPLLSEVTTRYATRDEEEGHWQVRDPQALRNAILALNVLDPATGSGHFLVDATAYIAEWLRSLALAPSDIGSTEDELIYWKRQVANACMYGVDLNPLAVELAKLSLWLTTLARGKPLSFLDHRIKCGNSLVGAWIQDIDMNLSSDPAKPTQGGDISQMQLSSEGAVAPTVSSALDQMDVIERTVAERVDQVKQQEKLYDEFTAKLANLRRIADAWLSRHFGVKIDQAIWTMMWNSFLGKDIPNQSIVEQLMAEADHIAREQHFFHWQLMFPEIFFSPEGKFKSSPGFDAVIGNPPYVRQERIQPIKSYLAANFKVYQGTADLFLYFYEQGLRLLKPEQRLGYITSGTYMNSNSSREFRKYINSTAAFDAAINFGENQPFKAAEMVFPTIAILKKGMPDKTFRSLFIERLLKHSDNDKAFVEAVSNFAQDAIDCLSDVTAMREWRFQSPELTELFRKVSHGYTTLGEIVSDNIYMGLITGRSDIFIIKEKTRTDLISEDGSSAEIIRPLLRGEDLRPWYQMDSGEYLILTKEGTDITKYPAIERYLLPHRELLAKRYEPAHGQCEWYELRPCSYYSEFERPKLFWPEIAKLPRVSFDSSGYYSNNKGSIIICEPLSPYVLLGLLQSRIHWFCLSQIATPLRLRAGLWQYQLLRQFIERLPIPELTTEHQSRLSEFAETITTKAQERYQIHEAMRRRIVADLGKGGKLNEKLEEWWLLTDAASLRAEVKKAFKADIPVAERNEWDKFLAAEKAKHEQITAEIVALETKMNGIVYEAFQLTPDEISLIEKATKYRYGEP